MDSGLAALGRMTARVDLDNDPGTTSKRPIPLIVQRRITRTWFASSNPVARWSVQRLSHTMHWRGLHTCV
jgi:hypothetical protein